MENVKQINKIMRFLARGIYSAVLKKSEKYYYALICLSKETNIDTHKSTRPGFIYVIKGKGIMLNDEEIELSQGNLITIEENEPHSFKSEGI
ncbi:MAG: cupin domain-containing protein [Nanobdellota archaeon]